MEYDQWIDPELAPIVEALGPLLGDLTAERLRVVRAERAAALALVQGSDAVERTDHVVPGRHGDPDVVVRVHRPVSTQGPLPCLYFMHGGGYVLGTYKMEDVRL